LRAFCVGNAVKAEFTQRKLSRIASIAAMTPYPFLPHPVPHSLKGSPINDMSPAVLDVMKFEFKP